MSIGGMLLFSSMLFNLTWNNLALRALNNPEPPDRRIAAEQVLAQIPPDASVGASQFLGPHLARRRNLYFFPGNKSYPFPLETVEYIVADLNIDSASVLGVREADPSWKTVAQDDGYVLLKRQQ
jgi:hypothetical protein